MPTFISTIKPRLIEVIPYNPEWPKLFALEAELIKQALGENCVAIHHMGSTAIPSLSAKPVIDILPVVKDIQEVDLISAKMESLGYAVKGEYGIAFRRFFQKGENPRTHHVHIYQENDPEIDRYLKFRDWLRSHEIDLRLYEKLKIELAAQFPYDILNYCNGKDAFVASIDAKDGYEGYRMVGALMNREWAAIDEMKIKKGDPSPLLKEPNQRYLVFYHNAEIVGYIHLQLNNNHQVKLNEQIMKNEHHKERFASLFLNLCQRWLKHQKLELVQEYLS